MADIYLTRTNQKLGFARLHLDALQQAQDSTGWSKHALIESYNESVLFHLKGALQAFVREIAEHYRLACDSVDDVAGLQQQLEASGQESPELTELLALANQSGGWLQLLNQAYAACWQAQDQRAAVPGPGQSRSEIHVVQINPNHAEDRDLLAEYRSWFAALAQLIDRLRAGMQEW